MQLTGAFWFEVGVSGTLRFRPIIGFQINLVTRTRLYKLMGPPLFLEESSRIGREIRHFRSNEPHLGKAILAIGQQNKKRRDNRGGRR